jgi:hypothetical protein
VTPGRSRGPPTTHTIRVYELTTHPCSSPCSVSDSYINAQGPEPVPAHEHALGNGGLNFHVPPIWVMPTFEWPSAAIIGKLLRQHGISYIEAWKHLALHGGKPRSLYAEDSAYASRQDEFARSSRAGEGLRRDSEHGSHLLTASSGCEAVHIKWSNSISHGRGNAQSLMDASKD